MEALTTAVTTTISMVLSGGTEYITWVMETPLVLVATALSFAGVIIGYARSSVRGQ